MYVIFKLLIDAVLILCFFQLFTKNKTPPYLTETVRQSIAELCRGFVEAGVACHLRENGDL